MQWIARWSLTRWIGLPMVVALAFVTLPVRVTGQAQSAKQTAQATFTKDIAPILQRTCQNCHRPGSMAPMSLITYEEVRPWARSIKHRTALGSKPEVMPPWFIEKNIGIQHYKDDMSLTDEEIGKIAAWADNGAPRGNPADMPPPRTFAAENEWRLGQPDLVVSSPSFEIRAIAPDWWGPIGDTPTGLTEDRYVASIEMREVTELSAALEGAKAGQTIGGHSIFHHLAWRPMGGQNENPRDEESWPLHEVGRNADQFNPAAGKLLRAGSKLSFVSAHVHANGKRTKARVDVGFKFHPKAYKPTKKFVNINVFNRFLDIKGLEANQKFEGFQVLTQHTKLMVFEPHMHAAGVRMCLDAIWNNTSETLSCAGYNHSWVRVYTYTEDAQPLLPKGTILRGVGYFDTTPGNKNVSDPRNWSGLGHRSMDNMSITIATGIPLTDEEFEQEMAKRRERLKLRPGQTVAGCPLCGYQKARTVAAAQ